MAMGDYEQEHRQKLKDTCDINRLIIMRYMINTRSLCADQIAVGIRDDLYDDLDCATLGSDEWNEIVNDINNALQCQTKWDGAEAKLKTENADFKKENALLKARILELELTPLPGPLFLKAKKEWNSLIKDGGDESAEIDKDNAL